MAKFFGNLHLVLVVGLIAAIVVIACFTGWTGEGAKSVTDDVFRWLHAFFGILWIGLLYYFNFVQIRKMPEIPAELKPAVSKYIAPEALFWFRWAALATVLAGIILAWNRGYLVEAYTLGATEGFSVPQHTFIGVGMWLGTIMFLNVWLFIWPNQKIALGRVEADADAKAKAARTAMLFSRTNLLLSLPMLATMTMNQTLFG